MLMKILKCGCMVNFAFLVPVTDWVEHTFTLPLCSCPTSRVQTQHSPLLDNLGYVLGQLAFALLFAVQKGVNPLWLTPFWCHVQFKGSVSWDRYIFLRSKPFNQYFLCRLWWFSRSYKNFSLPYAIINVLILKMLTETLLIEFPPLWLV